MPIRGRYLAFGAHQPKGFSLLEVVIVVAIIGILATLAYPSLEGYLQRAKQSEIKTNLAAIHTAEKLYHASNGSYTDDFAVLGVGIADDAIYSYGITATASTFTATATANLDDDATEDTWNINQDKQLVQTTDDLTD